MEHPLQKHSTGRAADHGSVQRRWDGMNDDEALWEKGTDCNDKQWTMSWQER